MAPASEDHVGDALVISVYDVGQHATVVEVDGEIDLASVGALRTRLTALADAAKINVVLALGGVTFMDSSGLGAIVTAHRRLQSLGGALVLAWTNGSVVSVLRPTRLDTVVPVFASAEEALASEFAG